MDYTARRAIAFQISFRQLRPADWGAYERLMVKSFKPLYGWTLGDARFINKSVELKPGRSPTKQFGMVACLHEEIIGGGLVSLNKRREFEVKRVCVDPKFQGFGIAKRLLEQLELHARKAGIKRLVLYASSKEDIAAGYAMESFLEKLKRICIANFSMLQVRNQPDLVEMYMKYEYIISGEDQFHYHNVQRTRMIKVL